MRHASDTTAHSMSAGRLTVPETSEYLRVPAATLQHWRTRGIGPRWYKLGKHVMYDRVDVDAFVESRKSATP